jgi:hypothetical protein
MVFHMKIALFQSGLETGMYAYTLDETGANLPDEFAPWKPIRILCVTGSVSQDRTRGLGALVLQALKEDGFSCVCSRSASERLRKSLTSTH